jgi:hypothetical protein
MKMAKAEVLRVLRNVGLREVADELQPLLPEVVDFDRDYRLFERYGLEQGVLRDRMGASP